MKKDLPYLIIFIILNLSLFSVSAQARSKINTTNKVKWIHFSLIAPTQFNIGRVAMIKKRDKLLKKYNKNNIKSLHRLRTYLVRKAAPAYLAQDGRYYIIDHHHTSRALYEARLPLHKFPIKVIKDLSHLSMNNFFNYLQNKNRLYLYDNGKGPLDPFTLPPYIWDLSDDPYRTLSGEVRHAGGYDKTNIYFLEFLWADYFRSKISLKNGGDEVEINKVLPMAIKMAHDSNASQMPGYKPKPATIHTAAQ